jgi:predicted Zn finger-like uncharacterized protein
VRKGSEYPSADADGNDLENGRRMKITCQECQSNFTVADDKVAGTIVKIRCKKCGATMVVNGKDGTTRTDRPSLPDDAPALSARELDDGSRSGEKTAPAASSSDISGARAARREGGRDQGKDLFGDAAIAGSETEDEKREAKLKGERNESSVLFSLKSLTKDEDKPKEAPKAEGKTTATGDGSGLIDIRALAGTKGDEKSSRGVEDILSLGGGGAFGATLSAPDLSSPAHVSPSVAPAAQQEKNNRGIIFAIVGSAVFLGVAVVGAIVFTRPSDPPPKTGSTSDMGSALAMNDPPKSPTTVTPTSSPTPTPTDTSNAKPPGQLPTSIPASSHGGGTTAPGKPTKPDAPVEPVATAPTTPKPLSLEEELRKKAAAPPAPAKTAEAPAGGTFDRAAAGIALNGVSIVGCKKPDGPTGAGHVTVTFDSSGSVQSAIVDGGDFPGTPVGGCIAGKYRGAHVPPFSGSPVKVGKSFNL